MLPTKLLVLFSAFIFAVSGQGITYYGTSNVRNQSRPPPRPLTLRPLSYQSQPDNAPRPVYIPPPPVAPTSETTANSAPIYAVSANQYQPSQVPSQPPGQSTFISEQPNLSSSEIYSGAIQPLEPPRPLPPLSPPMPPTFVPSNPEPDGTITEGPSISYNNWYPQPISSEPSPPPSLTPIRETVAMEENQSDVELSPTITTTAPEKIITVLEPETAPEPAPIDIVNAPLLYHEALPSNNPTTRQHITPGWHGATRPLPASPGSNQTPMPQPIPFLPGSNYIVTTLRPPPIFPPLNPAPRNPEEKKPQPPSYPVYPSPIEIPTLPPLQPQPIPVAPVSPNKEQPLHESSSPIPETSPPIIPTSDAAASSESGVSKNPIELPEPSPAPSPPPEEPIVPPIDSPASTPEPVYPSEKPIVSPIELPEPSPEPKYPPSEPIIPPIVRPAPSPIPVYPTPPEPPVTSTQPPVIIPGPVYQPEQIVPIQPSSPRPAPLYPPQQPIIPPIEQPAPTPLPSYPTPEPPAPSTQPAAPKPALINPPSMQPPEQRPPPIYPIPEPISTLKPSPLYPVSLPPKEPVEPSVQPPNLQPLYPPTIPTNRPPAFISEPLESKLIIGFSCSRGNGYYAIAEQCDSYVECQANQAWQIYCPDGLHFNPNAIYPGYPCAYPSEVKCAGSTVKQIAHPTSECPRQYGFFPSNDGDCSKYVNCQEGKATLMNCPLGLVFNDALSSCDWPENVPQCNSKAFKDFTCPAPPLDSEGNPSDIIYKYKYGSHCKMYLACQRGHPRLLRCDRGLSFDENSQACIDSDLVPNCKLRT